MHVVEADREPGAVGDEFLESGALFGNARGDDTREHQPERDDEQTQTKHDRTVRLTQCESPHSFSNGLPFRSRVVSLSVITSSQHHVVLIEAVERFHLQPYRPSHLVLELRQHGGLVIEQAVDHILVGQN